MIDHDGKLIEDVGWFWDHAEDRHKIAHDYLIANYVCRSGKHYPLQFRRFKKRDQCEAKGEAFEDHRQLIDWVCEREIPGDFTFDSYFSSAENLNHLHSKQNDRGESRGYVGDLKTNRKLAARHSPSMAWIAVRGSKTRLVAPNQALVPSTRIFRDAPRKRTEIETALQCRLRIESRQTLNGGRGNG